MKRLFIFLLFAVATYGQNIELYGSFYGHNSYLLNKDDYEAPDTQITPLATKRMGGGIGVSFGLLNKVFVGGEIYYSAEGQKYEGKLQGSGSPYEGFYEVNYVKLPLFLEYRKNFSKAYITFRGGPQVWFLVSGLTTVTVWDANTGEISSEILADKDSMYLKSYIEFWGVKDTIEVTYAFSRIPHNLVLFGGWGSVGFGFNFTKKLGMDLNFRVDYAFTDNEAKETLRTDRDNPNNVSEVWAIKPRFNDLNTPPDFKAADRPKTHNMTLGIQARIHYKIR